MIIGKSSSGLKLYLVTAPDGMPVTWCLADPKLGEREVCLDLLTIAVETGLVVPGATVLADKGLAGRDVEQQIAELGVRLLRPDRRNEPRRHGSLGGVRQWIESVFDTLKGQLGLEHHGARTAHDVFTRVAQRLLALVAAVAQLGDQRFRRTQPHRLRPLTRLSFKAVS